ncbi:MAG: hypothetical protein QOH21_1671, partial [Acidobacteriota bacterium]|nr:hypothetical protein [Acidobacteriota bacterium]
PTHKFGFGRYTVTLTIVVQTGTKSAFIGFSSDPIVRTPTNVSFTVPTPRPTAGEPTVFTASAYSGSPITGWIWRFDDGTPATVATSPTTTHTFKNAGTYNVSLSASNTWGPSVSVTRTVTVAPRALQPFSMIVPVVAHTAGSNGSFWKTDVHVFASPPSTAPVILNLDFRGVRKSSVTDATTFVARDILASVTNEETGGILRISGVGYVPPTVWTRTYNTSSGGTFGQAIPVVAPVTATSAGSSSPLILGGIEDNNRFRTNLGLANLSDTELTVRIDAIRRNGIVGTTQVVVAAASLVQLPLGSLVSGVTGPDPCGLRITPKNSTALYAYASVIDAVTNDPTFISAVPEDELTESQLLVPGMGHVGAWRSDLFLFNSQERLVKVKLEYFDDQGKSRSVAEDVTLTPGESVTLRDAAWNAAFSPRLSSDITGTIQVTVLAGPRPFLFGRTYNQQSAGTFGQGIAPVDMREANVVRGGKAALAAVLENTNAYTNLGLTTVGMAEVKVTLLHPGDTRALGSQTFTIGGNGSRIIPNIVRLLHPTATEGSLQVELVSGTAVWAYASLVDRKTADPEYVPAVVIP